MTSSARAAHGRALQDQREPTLATARRELAVAAVVCAVGAGLVLFAGSRTWITETVTRPAPLGPVSTPRTGAALVPALTAVALVALAGAGALLAARGRGRRLVGILIVVGGMTAAGLVLSVLGRDGVTVGWVLAAMIGGLVASGGGAFAVARGATWPGLGARYDRPTGAVGRPGADDRHDGSDQVDSGSGGSGEAVNRALWDSLDRGEDPTKS